MSSKPTAKALPGKQSKYRGLQVRSIYMYISPRNPSGHKSKQKTAFDVSRLFWPDLREATTKNNATVLVAFTQMQLKPLQTQLGIILPNRLEKVFEC